MNCLVVEKLSKEIDGITIFDNVNLKMEQGKIYGFVGANGSGKTMLFRTLSGLIAPSTGKIIYNDSEVVFSKDRPFSVGLMIENAGMFPDFSGYDNLKYLASINNKITCNQIKENIERVGLDPKDKRKIKKYSLGMRQRITFAQAIMEAPDVLLLDEPTNALDTKGIDDIRNIILEEKKRGAIICIASHNADDIKILCDQIYQITEGKIEKRHD